MLAVGLFPYRFKLSTVLPLYPRCTPAVRPLFAMWIVDRPIYQACVGGSRKRGSSARRQWWWEQPMGLEPNEELPVNQVA